MIDTIKLKIPLSSKQHSKIVKSTIDDGEKQWVQYTPKTGELSCVRIKGLAETDQNSFHREIRFDVREDYIPDNTFMVFEFSIPKYFYGHNVSLLYDFMGALAHFKRSIEKQFNLSPKYKCDRLPDISTWLITRLDICYAWEFPSQDICHKYLNSLSRIKYPRLQPAVYPTSIYFRGTTYTLKFYEKLPEFKANDGKALKKSKANPQWISYLEQKASGILRCEATLRYKYLKKIGIKTVADLANDRYDYEFSGEQWEQWKDDRRYQLTGVAIALVDLEEQGIDTNNLPDGYVVTEEADGDRHIICSEDGKPTYAFRARNKPSTTGYERLVSWEPEHRPNHDDFIYDSDDSCTLTNPLLTSSDNLLGNLADPDAKSECDRVPAAAQDLENLDLSSDLNEDESEDEFMAQFIEPEHESFVYSCTGKSFTIRHRDKLQSILQRFIKKFLGENAGMQTVDQVQIKLAQHYKPVKVSRLVAFWLYVQKFGTNNTRDNFGRQNFDYNKRDLKKAGVSLLEPSIHLTNMGKDFLEGFKMEVPSPHVANKVDDFNDGDNLLNIRTDKSIVN